ncbi:hypothetical protein PS659_05191 [Pseudomonas fluorescens]|uniref:Uncharacterized protein n=1 Tax=Pseudomonas fluorescens TaxID=294 RepID=A0A5E6X955_PSEFL|nr:hypothetical protein PS659_05191 [Pseudomonas fluorescens]
MLAMVVNDNAGSLNPRSGLWFFASLLAPTGSNPISYPRVVSRR